MKKAISIILILCMSLIFVSCKKERVDYSLYFASLDKRALTEEKIKDEKKDSVEESARFLIGKLLAGPSSPDKTRIIPEGTNVIDISVRKNVAQVNFSQEFEKNADSAQRLLSLYSVVNTLCSLDGINRVQVLVNGRAIKNEANKEDIGPLSINNVITTDEIRRNQTAVAELYFASADKDSLVSEKRMIDLKDNETIEKNVITELIKGPGKIGKRLIPSNVKLLSVEAKDRICYVNFSKEFGEISSKNSLLAIYSVVNTIVKLGQSDGVQFLIEGEKVAKIGSISLVDPLYYNKVIIAK